MDSQDVRQKRRTLIDALLAIYGVTTPMVRIDERLAATLEQAWADYDSAVVAAAPGDTKGQEGIL